MSITRTRLPRAYQTIAKGLDSMPQPNIALSGKLATNVGTAQLPNSSNLSSKLGGGLSVLSGGIDLANQWGSMASEADNINTNAPESKTDYYGKPEYNLGNFVNEVDSIKPEGASFGEVTNGALTGASAGAAFGPIGAGVGALIGGIGSAIFGDSRKSEMERKKRLAIANLRTAQMQYNKAGAQFNLQQSGMSQYNDLQNTANRQNNLYNYNNPYA